MTPNHKKLLFGLSTLIIILLLFLVRAIRTTLDISTSAATATPLVPFTTMIPVNSADQSLGNPGAALLIIEFVDLGNSTSLSTHKLLSTFAAAHPRDVRLVFKHAPVYHFFVDTPLASQAAYCAGKQGKLFAFVDAIAGQDLSLRESGLRKAADAAKLDTNVWWDCANSAEAQQAVQSDTAEAQSLAVGKPPLVFINNNYLNLTSGIDVEQLLSTLISK